MKNSKLVFQELVEKIALNDYQEEIKAIALILMDKVLGASKTDIMAGKMVSVSEGTLNTLEEYVTRINRFEPVQYVVGEGYFYGRPFKVNHSVLIPRPETEELVRAVLKDENPGKGKAPKVLDIGTGSGCIAITLFLEHPGATIYASDISVEALSVAGENASFHDARINLARHDILKEIIPFESLDVIVSNPPYVAESERSTIRSNVLEFEPHSALFVPDDDPLIFYREIVKKGKRALRKGGLLSVEINERFGDQVSELFRLNHFAGVEIILDVAGKPRVVIGRSE